jgi:hypothetical protein
MRTARIEALLPGIRFSRSMPLNTRSTSSPRRDRNPRQLKTFGSLRRKYSLGPDSGDVPPVRLRSALPLRMPTGCACERALSDGEHKKRRARSARAAAKPPHCWAINFDREQCLSLARNGSRHSRGRMFSNIKVQCINWSTRATNHTLFAGNPAKDSGRRMVPRIAATCIGRNRLRECPHRRPGRPNAISPIAAALLKCHP